MYLIASIDGVAVAAVGPSHGSVNEIYAIFANMKNRIDDSTDDKIKKNKKNLHTEITSWFANAAKDMHIEDRDAYAVNAAVVRQKDRSGPEIIDDDDDDVENRTQII